MEKTMRHTAIMLSMTLGILAASSLAPTQADAMTFSTPSAIQAAVDDSSLAKDVAYICRRAWRCGYWGCGWRRACFWSGPRYYGRRWYNGRRWYRGRRW